MFYQSNGLSHLRGSFIGWVECTASWVLVLECSADSVDFDALSMEFAGDDGRSVR